MRYGMNLTIRYWEDIKDYLGAEMSIFSNQSMHLLNIVPGDGCEITSLYGDSGWATHVHPKPEWPISAVLFMVILMYSLNPSFCKSCVHLGFTYAMLGTYLGGLQTQMILLPQYWLYLQNTYCKYTICAPQVLIGHIMCTDGVLTCTRPCDSYWSTLV